MVDHLTKDARSKNMAAIKSKNTSPELIVRKILFSEGYRYRIHDSKLPGKPDIVLKKYKTVIFVHGCFWHSHANCKRANMPKTNLDYWSNKISKNVDRDKEHYEELKEGEWKILIIWECQTKDREQVRKLLSKVLRKK